MFVLGSDHQKPMQYFPTNYANELSDLPTPKGNSRFGHFAQYSPNRYQILLFSVEFNMPKTLIKIQRGKIKQIAYFLKSIDF